MTDVRPAQPADRAGILELCRQLHAENGQHEIDWAKVEAMIDRALRRDNAIIGLVGPVGEPVGAVLILLDPIWYSAEMQLLELFNFVRADSRKTDYAKSLIAYAKGCADATGLDLTIGITSDVRMEAKCRLYARHLPKAGEFYIFRPETRNIGTEAGK